MSEKIKMFDVLMGAILAIKVIDEIPQNVGEHPDNIIYKLFEKCDNELQKDIAIVVFNAISSYIIDKTKNK